MDYINNLDARVFLKSLNDNTVDLILTDPPYIISKKTGFKSVKQGIKRFSIDTDFGVWDNKDIIEHNTLLLEVFSDCYRVLKPSGTIIIWYDLWKIESLKNLLLLASDNEFKMFRFIEWLKTNPVPINSKNLYLTNSREVAIVAVKGGKPVFNSEYHNGVFEYPIHRDGGKRIHPTQKSLILMQELIRIHSNKDALVVDPFSGSGTTILAALLEGRQGKGCELDENYCKLANSRIIDFIGDPSIKPVWEI